MWPVQRCVTCAGRGSKARESCKAATARRRQDSRLKRGSKQIRAIRGRTPPHPLSPSPSLTLNHNKDPLNKSQSQTTSPTNTPNPTNLTNTPEQCALTSFTNKLQSSAFEARPRTSPPSPERQSSEPRQASHPSQRESLQASQLEPPSATKRH